MKRWLKKIHIDWLLVGTLALLTVGYVLLHDLCGGTLFAHNDWDSYTLQALAWRDGRMALQQNYSWLELAVYNGHYYVSFPPVPSLVMLPLTYFYGANTPSNTVVLAYALIAVVCAYEALRKAGVRPGAAMGWAVFYVMGSNMLWMSTSGGVWFQAQGLNLALCTGGIWALLCGRKTLCLTLLALAVGCRPFSLCLLAAAFGVFCWQAMQKDPQHKARAVWAQARSLLLPAAIGLCYGAYNFARFGNPLEFGHNYLPEFTAPGSAQFGLGYLWQNVCNILRPVTVNANGQLNFPLFNGFLFFVANPLFVIWFVALVRDLHHKTLTTETKSAAAALAVNFVLLLVHKTFGGWQFGARYTVDLLPYVLWYLARSGLDAPRRWQLFLGVFAILFNAYGALYMTLAA